MRGGKYHNSIRKLKGQLSPTALPGPAIYLVDTSWTLSCSLLKVIYQIWSSPRLELAVMIQCYNSMLVMHGPTIMAETQF